MRTIPPGGERARAGTSAAIVALGLAALIALALALRWSSTTRLLPHSPEPDAYVVMLAQDYRGDPALVQHREFAERYPVLLARLLAAMHWPEPAIDSRRPDAAQTALDAGAAPYVAGRLLVLALSLLAIPGTWLVARRIAGERAAWIASALVATSLLHALFSTQARPHGPQAAIGVLAVWAAMRLARGPTVARAAVAVALASLALATLQIGASTLPPLACAGWIAGGTRAKRALRAALLPLLAVVGASWAYPFALRFDEHGLRLGGEGAHELSLGNVDFSGLYKLSRMLAEHDPVLFVLAVAGLALILARWRASARAAATNPDVAVALAFVLPYVAVLAPLGEVFERFLLPILPFVATVAAIGIVRCAGQGARRVAIGGAIAVVAPLLVLAHFARVSAAPDTAEVVVRWLEEHPEAGDAVVAASPGLVLPIAFESDALRADVADRAGRSSPWPMFQGTRPEIASVRPRLAFHMTPNTLAQRPQEGLETWFDGVSPRYVILERSSKTRFLPGGRELASLVRRRGTLVFRTDGEAPEVEQIGVLHYQAIERFVTRLLRTEQFGAALEVWRIDR